MFSDSNRIIYNSTERQLENPQIQQLNNTFQKHMGPKKMSQEKFIIFWTQLKCNDNVQTLYDVVKAERQYLMGNL